MKATIDAKNSYINYKTSVLIFFLQGTKSDRIMKYLILILLGFSIIGYRELSRPAEEKKIQLSTLDELEERLSNGGDTTFVINFWATWCVPCVKEMPYFEKMASKMAGKPFKLLFISLDSPKKPKVVEDFISRKKIMSEVLIFNETDQQEYIDRVSKEWSGAIPATLFIQTTEQKRAFYEQEFTLQELDQAIQNFQDQLK